jgi:hypothetical protein
VGTPAILLKALLSKIELKQRSGGREKWNRAPKEQKPTRFGIGVIEAIADFSLELVNISAINVFPDSLICLKSRHNTSYFFLT